MAAGNATKRSGSRNVRYPKVELGDAVTMMKQVAVHGRAHPKAAMASYLGHDTLNSGTFLTKMGALRDWGFIDGRGDDIEVTDAGYAVAHASDEQTVARVMRDAFVGARVFGDLYAKTAKGVPVRTSDIASRAVLEFGVAPSAKKAFLRTFLESAQAAGCASTEGDTVTFLEPGAVSPELPAESETTPDEPTSSQSAGPAEKAVVLRQVWAGARADVVLEVRSNEPLRADVFAKLGEIVGALDELASTFGSPQAQEGCDE